MFGSVITALIPIALLIALGTVLRKRNFLTDTFWEQAERVGYYFFLPALFVYSLATADLGHLHILHLAAAVLATSISIAVLVLLCRPLLSVNGPTFTSIFQGSLRFNTYVGTTVAGSLYGDQGIAMAALCAAIAVPTVNFLCILAFAHFGTVHLTLRGVLRQIFKNPLIIACVLGLSLQGLHIPLPMGITPFLKALGEASLPLGLMCVGAALQLTTLKGTPIPILTAISAKSIATPLVAVLLLSVFDVHGATAVVAVLFLALPTSSASYILSRQLGGDAPLMAGITALQTVFAAISLPFAGAIAMIWQ